MSCGICIPPEIWGFRAHLPLAWPGASDGFVLASSSDAVSVRESFQEISLDAEGMIFRCLFECASKGLGDGFAER